jgi:hypothetical protein
MADLVEKDVSTATGNVTITTTTEKVAITSPAVRVPLQTARVLVKGWAQVTTGADTTALTPRLRKGDAITGTLLGEANAEAVKAAAGSTEAVQCWAIDTVSNVDSVQYSFTVQQTGASADGTIVQSGIDVEVLNG